MTMTENKKPARGRPTEYKEDYNKQAFHLTLLGATDKELATSFGVKEQTITNWKRTYKDFFASIKEGKIEADANVSNSLYKKALGGHFIEKQKVIIVDGKEKIITLKEQVPPDTTSAIFWLKNRQPDKWRDKVDVNGKFDLGEVSLEWVKENFLDKMDDARKRQEAALADRDIEE